MASFNRVILLGNLTRDVEVKYLTSGTAVAEIGLAINDRRKGTDGNWIEETTFVDVTMWARTAEIAAEYLTKGSPVLIEGRLKLDTWETDGQKRSKLRVVCERMQMVGSKGDGGESQKPYQGKSMKQQKEDYERKQAAPPPGEDIPFVWLVPFISLAITGGQQWFA